MRQLGQATPRLLCSLVHKFGRKDVDDFEAFIKELESQPSPTVAEVFVFVDECHRTQSGKLNRVMKAMMPNAVFIGFTGTPLLVKDRKTSLEIFGGYIHTYKFSEGVERRPPGPSESPSEIALKAVPEKSDKYDKRKPANVTTRRL